MLHEEQEAHSAELKAENEVKKLMLEIDHNAQFVSGDEEIPPEIETVWLDNIRNFEELHKNANQVTIFKLIGEPQLRKSEDIPDEEIKSEFEQLMSLLESKGISFDALAEYPDPERLFYKFITEKLFLEETDDFFIPGGFSCFIYEEFVPNHEYDIRKRTEELIKYVFDDMRVKNERFDEYFFESEDFEEIENEGKQYKQKISPALTNFFNSFPVRELIDNQIKNIDYRLTPTDEDEKIQGNAYVDVIVHYTATTEKGDKVNFTGTGNLQLNLEWDWWRVVKVELPGLILG